MYLRIRQYLLGVLTLANTGGTITIEMPIRRRGRTLGTPDADAIAGYWEATGDYIREAIDSHGQKAPVEQKGNPGV